MKRKENIHILYLDDSFSAINAFREKASEYGFANLYVTQEINNAIKLLEEGKIDVFISDLTLDYGAVDNAFQLFQQAYDFNRQVKSYVYTAHLVESRFFEFAKKMGTSFIFKYESLQSFFDRILIDCQNIQSEVINLYNNEIVEKISVDASLILPETTTLISDIKFINKNYYELIKKRPNIIYELSPRQFEEFTAELFEKRGYKVTLTPSTRDGGKDLLILQNSILGNFLIYTECKRHLPQYPVGVRVVRSLLGTVTADGATAGIIVTSSYFTADAKILAEQVKHKMSLIDFTDLSKWIAENK